jgi:hypothetical protein
MLGLREMEERGFCILDAKALREELDRLSAQLGAKRLMDFNVSV